MTRILISLLIIFFVLHDTHAQLSTIGPFMPGKTTSSTIDSIATAHNIQIQKTGDENEVSGSSLDGKTDQIFYVLHNCKHNDALKHFSDSPIDKDHEVYHIDYLMADGLLYSDIWLHFWKNILYSVQFNISADKLQKLMNDKYGEGIVAKSEANTKRVACRDSDGAAYNGEESRIVTHYKTISPDLEAWCTKSKYYNSECEAVYSEYFVFMNTKVDDLVRSREKKIEQEHELVQKRTR
ncbi:MAG: hypothetical protein JNK79_01085 [Chitinophagaceae bacterium]|nr:hypothetical protein [Chitinophagaceae bacterium]